MTEIGECPGLDHMLAMKCVDEVMATGGKVGHALFMIVRSLLFSFF